MSLSNRIFEAWSKILRISHAMVSARYSAKINVKRVAVWIIFPFKWDRQPSQWPIARQVYQFTQLRLSITQLDSRRIVASDTPCTLVSMSYRPSDRSRNASYAASNLSWSEATDEASKMVHSESVEELSDTPDQPLSSPDPLSSPYP